MCYLLLSRIFFSPVLPLGGTQSYTSSLGLALPSGNPLVPSHPLKHLSHRFHGTLHSPHPNCHSLVNVFLLKCIPSPPKGLGQSPQDHPCLCCGPLAWSHLVNTRMNKFIVNRPCQGHALTLRFYVERRIQPKTKQRNTKSCLLSTNPTPHLTYFSPSLTSGQRGLSLQPSRGALWSLCQWFTWVEVGNAP